MKDFDEIYSKIDQTELRLLESKRNKIIKIVVAIICVVTILVIMLAIVTKAMYFMFLEIGVIILYIILDQKIKRYRTQFKTKIIGTFVKEYDSNLEYTPEGGIQRSIYMGGEFERFDKIYSQDYIKGKLNNEYYLKMSEVKTKILVDEKEITVFHGVFEEIELTKIIDANLKIRRKEGKASKGKIQMDSSEFEKVFDVYTTNQIMAMQILTSDIMQMLIEFKTTNNIVPELTINKNKLYIRFATGNIFEPRLSKQSSDYKSLLEYYKIINFTLGLTEKILKNIKETEI